MKKISLSKATAVVQALQETHLNHHVVSVHVVRKKQKSSVHEGKKPFSCKICDVRFTQSGISNGHISAVHEVNEPLNVTFVMQALVKKGA